MNTVTVTLLRDPETSGWWLANFTLGDRSYTTQGAILDEARYMAADLLKLVGADADAEVTFELDDRETLSSLLARPVTPSLFAEPDTSRAVATT